MRLARHALNALARTGGRLVVRAPDEAVRAAGTVVQRTLGRRVDLPDFGNWRAATIRDATSLMFEAIAETPYDRPLEFHEPLFVTLSTSRYCPVGCANCYSSSSKVVAKQSGDRFLSNARQVAASRSPIVAILGGEPFLHPDLIEAVNALTDAGKSVSVATNWKVNGEQLRKLHDPKMVSLLVSLWGTRSRHDELRGRGSYERILANARAAKDCGLKSSLLVVLSDQVLAVLDEAEALLRVADFDVLQITRKIEVGRRSTSETAARFDVDDLRDRARLMRRLCRQVVVDLPEMRPDRRRGWVSELFGIQPFSGCGAGSWLWHIDSRGEGHACPVGEGVAHKADELETQAPSFLGSWRNRKINADKGQAGCRYETTT